MSTAQTSLTDRFFESRGWLPLPFQYEVWKAIREGKSGLVHSATGSGKTLSIWLGFLQSTPQAEGLKAIWITPLRSLAQDTLKALQEATEGHNLDWQIELRTGDTSSSVKQRQVKNTPDVLITTPESLTLMLTRKESFRIFENLNLMVVDEWHELLGTKRGVQTELALARLRTISPKVMTWGLSATLGNTNFATQVLIPQNPTIIKGEEQKEVTIDTLLPPKIERFPWAGHIGVRMVPEVVAEIEKVTSALVFTNTRAQAEIWYQAIQDQNPPWKDQVGLHHGSIDKEVRLEVEDGLKSGKLRAVVCTSSLDLGVDFSPVDRVFQVGSPKGVARLLQRAGRSGHQPGAPSRVTCVPTHALELLDISAAREAATKRHIEGRGLYTKPLDVLSQHIVSMALAGGFREQKLLQEVRSTYAYQALTDEEWDWAIQYVTQGGTTLAAYPDFRKVQRDKDLFTVEDKRIAQRHRTNIGTIVSDGTVAVKYLKGPTIGSVEESFASRLKKGDIFIFAGRKLQFVRFRDMTVYVSRTKSNKGPIPRWAGGRLPLSTQLAQAVREKLADISDGVIEGPELQKMAPLLALQAKLSAVPDTNELLVEKVKSREGHHLFIFPVEGRLVHEGLASLAAYRLSQVTSASYSVACNDYGFELMSDLDHSVDEDLIHQILTPDNLTEDILNALNSSEMAKRQFREIARIAGLVFQGYPGSQKSTRQIQASSGLFYDVFEKYDPTHPLLKQSQKEVLERNLEQARLTHCLQRIAKSQIKLTHPPKPTPFAFPILVDRLRETIGNESAEDRIIRMVERLEKDE